MFFYLFHVHFYPLLQHNDRCKNITLYTAHRITRYCNVKILLNNTFNEGFIQSPGYPRYYVGDINCNWKLIAPEGQLIQLMFVDISLRSKFTYFFSLHITFLKFCSNKMY